KGLTARHLGGADLRGAQLDDGVLNEKALQNLDEASKSAGKLFVTMMTACAYVLLTIATTKQAPLLTNSDVAKLPVLDLSIPIGWFYAVAPAVLVGFYVYFHLYLQIIW